MNGPENVSVLNVDLPPDLAERVNRIASKTGQSPSDIVRGAIRRGIVNLGIDNDYEGKYGLLYVSPSDRERETTGL